MKSIKLAEFYRINEAEPDTIGKEIAYLWDKYHTQMRDKIEEWKELRNYVFATDTTKTSNSTLPWKNKTTLPKLTQIRDNLHANYNAALFPNDDWVKWVGYSLEDSVIEKARTIEAYIKNKAREGKFRTTVSKLLYDYVDYGNAFATTTFVERYKTNADGTTVPGYIGPLPVRISPLDIVFNPLADSFTESFKIIRSIKTIGEIKTMSKDEPDNRMLADAIEKHDRVARAVGMYSIEDNDKAEGFCKDGFGNMSEYYQSGYVEILEFIGDYHNNETGEIQRNKLITVIDRSYVIRVADVPSWLHDHGIYHVGWRYRPDNLWAMGPLDNLVGMQYRIDHLENLKADAMDLAVLPPMKIIGGVEAFKYMPGAEIHIDEGGDVQELGKNAQWVIAASNDIAQLEMRMEQYAGAPSEAMGIRSPGEKTAFEVSQLQNAAGRIFQEKLTNFEVNLLEPLLNAMLEVSVRNMNMSDVIRVMDDDLAVDQFMSITKEDITATGKLRPVGARHFAAQAQLVQNLSQLMASPVGQLVAPHVSGKQMAKLVEDVLHLERFQLFQPNIAVTEQKETQQLMAQTQEDLEVERSVQVSV